MFSRTESISFRMDKDSLDELKKHAEESQVSLSTLLNQIISGYMKWDAYATKAGYTTFEKDVLKMLFDNMTTEDLAKLAASTTKSFKDVLLLTSGGDESVVNLEAVLAVLENHARRSGFQYSAFSDKGAGKKKIVIQHDMGEKWSSFYKERIQEMIKFSGHSAKIDMVDDNKLMMTIEA